MRRGQRQGLSNLTVGAIVLAVIALGTFLGFRKEIPFRHHYEFSAAVKSANGIRKGSPVRIAGVNVGKVVGIRRAGPGESAARITMRLEKKGMPLHEDARVAIRPRIFLEGNFFVDVQPGSPSAPEIDEGDTIPIQQTRTPVQLDQVLTTLQAPTRRDLQRLLRSVSTGLSGEGAAGYNRSIRYWKDAYKQSALVNDATLGSAEHDLSGYIASAGATAAALDADPARLQSLITDFRTTAHAFAVRDGELSAALAELPRTLQAARPALDALNRAFPPLRSFVADLRPGVRSSGPALTAGLPFVRQLRALVRDPELRGLVADLRPTVPQLARLTQRSIPLYEGVRAASSCQNQVILPWSKDTIEDPQFPASGPVFQDSLKVLPGLAGESRSGDANGQWFRVLVNGGAYATPLANGRYMLSSEPIMGANPPPAPRSPLRRDVACETQEAPDLRTKVMPIQSRRAQIPAAKLPQQLKLRDQAVTWLRRQLKASGADKEGFSVSRTAATLEDVAQLKALRRQADRRAAARRAAP
jgi:virulence factor Mce-like protein